MRLKDPRLTRGSRRWHLKLNLRTKTKPSPISSDSTPTTMLTPLEFPEFVFWTYLRPCNCDGPIVDAAYNHCNLLNAVTFVLLVLRRLAHLVEEATPRPSRQTIEVVRNGLWTHANSWYLAAASSLRGWLPTWPVPPAYLRHFSEVCFPPGHLHRFSTPDLGHPNPQNTRPAYKWLNIDVTSQSVPAPRINLSSRAFVLGRRPPSSPLHDPHSQCEPHCQL